MSIGDYCTQAVHTASSLESLRAVAQRMAREEVGALVVTDRDEVTGIVTDRDLALEVLVGGRDPEETTVGELLEEKPVIVVHADSPLRVAAGMMRRYCLRRLPVLDRKEHLVGVITADDLLRVVGRELGGLADVIDAQSAREEHEA